MISCFSKKNILLPPILLKRQPQRQLKRWPKDRLQIWKVFSLIELQDTSFELSSINLLHLLKGHGLQVFVGVPFLDLGVSFWRQIVVLFQFDESHVTKPPQDKIKVFFVRDMLLKHQRIKVDGQDLLASSNRIDSQLQEDRKLNEWQPWQWSYLPLEQRDDHRQ